MSKIVPCLWYSTEAEEAAHFYASVIPNSRVKNVSIMQAESPGGPVGSVKLVEFTLAGQDFFAMTAERIAEFNHAISFMIECEDQAEIDRLSAALSEGGKVEPCGWVKDRYGLSWQITPRVLMEMMKDPDHAKAKRVAEAMMTMYKLDIAKLQQAFNGQQAA